MGSVIEVLTELSSLFIFYTVLRSFNCLVCCWFRGESRQPSACLLQGTHSHQPSPGRSCQADYSMKKQSPLIHLYAIWKQSGCQCRKIQQMKQGCLDKILHSCNNTSLACHCMVRQIWAISCNSRAVFLSSSCHNKRWNYCYKMTQLPRD